MPEEGTPDRSKLPKWSFEGYLNAQAQGLEDVHIRAYAAALLEAAAKLADGVPDIADDIRALKEDL